MTPERYVSNNYCRLKLQQIERSAKKNTRGNSKNR